MDAIERGMKALIAQGYAKADVALAASTVHTQIHGLQSISGAVRKCQMCERRKRCKMPVAGMGPITSPLMVVGEMPDSIDDEVYTPFAGAGGQILTLIFNKLGINRNHLYMTYIVKCKGERKPTYEDAMNCLPHFFNEIAVVKPRVILSLGVLPLQVLSKGEKSNIYESRGQWFIEDETTLNIHVMPTYNPSILLALEGEKLVNQKKRLWSDIQAAWAKVQEQEATK
jgi:uracil-DNA glycosylase family 4